MARGAANPYGSDGSVPYAPNVAPAGLNGPSLNARANAEDFGAQVGRGVEKVGEAGEALAKQYGDMVNETLMTKADADFATKLGQLKAGYQTKTGMAAFDAFPQYQADVAKIFQESRANLPMGAQHGFDMLGARSMANHIVDGSSYATSQLKEAQRASGSDLTNANIQAILDPSVASDPNRVAEHIGHAIYGAQMQLDENHPGLKTNENGEKTFDESTAEGKGLKAEFDANVDGIITKAQVNRFDTLAKGDVLGAFGIYQQERDSFPKQTQITLDSKFEPMVFNAHKDNAVGHAVAQSQDDYSKILYNPSSKTALDIVQKNEGGMSDDGQSAYGIDKNAHPKEFAEISSMPESDRSAYARKFFKEEYYDKKGIADLPANTQSIVMDGVVNHTTDFGNKLIHDAKNGASPQQLIDERRAEYERVAQIPGKEQYLKGWNARLDGFENGNALTGEKAKSYATNIDGSMLTQADYYRTNSADVLAKGDAYADSQMPGDLAFKRSVRETLNNYMSKTISNQSAQYTMDNKNVMRGITGELTRGNPPQTEQELRTIPGMNDLLNRVAAQDPKFAETIPTIISKVQQRNVVSNSANGYNAITTALDTSKMYSRQQRIDYLAKGLGSTNPGISISLKDFNDGKPAIDLAKSVSKPILEHMKVITSANGNADGKGQERSVEWYNNVMTAYKQNSALGDKKISDIEFVKQIKDGKFNAPIPSRMQQIENHAQEKATIPTIATKQQRDALPPNTIYMKDGVQYRTPNVSQ